MERNTFKEISRNIKKSAALTGAALMWVLAKDADAARDPWCQEPLTSEYGPQQLVCVESFEVVLVDDLKEKEELLVKEKVLERMRVRPEMFSQNDFEDVDLYWKIWRDVAKKYQPEWDERGMGKFDWKLLWILQKQESTVSRNPDAFNDSSGHIGAFQRHPSWSESLVDKAEEGLEYLAGLPQRYPTDSREAAFAAWHLTNIQKVDTDPVRGALRAYSAEGPAFRRYRIFLQYREIFGD